MLPASFFQTGIATSPGIASEVALCYRYGMSQPVKLSDSLVLDARLTSQISERSIAGQIEFWARLGRAVVPLLSGERVLALRQCGDARPLFELLTTVDAPEGHRRVAEYLTTQPFPHYVSAPEGEGLGRKGLLVRIEEDGKRTVGKFVGGKFCPAKSRQEPPEGSARKKNTKATKRRTKS